MTKKEIEEMTKYGREVMAANTWSDAAREASAAARRKMGGTIGKNTPEARDKALGEASQATWKARHEDTFENHKAAVEAHIKAAQLTDEAGFHNVAGEHRLQAAYHSDRANGSSEGEALSLHNQRLVSRNAK